jgi:hypothetical protein
MATASPVKPTAKKAKTAKPASPKMGINISKTHRTATTAINLPKTQRAKWNKVL